MGTSSWTEKTRNMPLNPDLPHLNMSQIRDDMNNKLGTEFEKIEEKVESSLNSPNDFGRFRQMISSHNLGLRTSAIKRIWERVKNHEHISTATLNKLALFAGFQSWQDFDETLHGETDAEINYEDDK